VVSLHRLVALVGGLAVAAAVGTAVAGPALVSLMFGPEYVVTHTAPSALLGGGTGVFMLVVADSYITVPLGGHPRMARAWIPALIADALPLVTLSDFIAQATVPLLADSAVASVLLAGSVRVCIRELTPSRLRC